MAGVRTNWSRLTRVRRTVEVRQQQLLGVDRWTPKPMRSYERSRQPLFDLRRRMEDSRAGLDLILMPSSIAYLLQGANSS
jgi:hypothetical protein